MYLPSLHLEHSLKTRNLSGILDCIFHLKAALSVLLIVCARARGKQCRIPLEACLSKALKLKTSTLGCIFLKAILFGFIGAHFWF